MRVVVQGYGLNQVHFIAELTANVLQKKVLTHLCKIRSADEVLTNVGTYLCKNSSAPRTKYLLTYVKIRRGRSTNVGTYLLMWEFPPLEILLGFINP